MRKLKPILLLTSSILLLASCGDENKTSDLNPITPSNPTSETHNNPDYKPGPLKVKNLQPDPDDTSKVGALFYGYDSNSSYSFDGTFKGDFKALMNVSKNAAGTKDLKSYSIIFKDNDNNEQFAVKVMQGLNFNNVAIVYNGQLCGINYFESSYAVGRHYGYTSIANNEGLYTKVKNTEPVDIFFDQANLTVSTKLEDGYYHLVWDFKSEYNDGKYLKHNIKDFNNYSVTLCFDEVSANGCANLMVYNFGNFDLSKDSVSDQTPSISPNITRKAIVNQEYLLPKPTMYGLNKTSTEYKILETVFDENGKNVSLTNRSFTPSKRGKYYVYYTIEGNDKIYNYALIEAINEAEQNYAYSEVNLPAAVGQGKKLIIPNITLTTNLGVNSQDFDCLVSIKKDGVILPNYEKVSGGFEYSFNQTGTYTLEFINPNFNSSLTKTIVVNTALAINEEEVSFKVGDTFKLPEIEFYKQGAKISYKTTVISPLGEKMKESFKITKEGIYKIQYQLQTEINPYEKSVAVYKENANLFTSDDAEFSTMTLSNEIKGIKIPLKNNEEVTYKNKIDLNKFKFDDSKDDKFDNPEILRIYAQPKNLGSADAEAIFIKLTDANDESNFVTIRLKFISYFSHGTFVRARGSNQAAYVGYYYNFDTTAREVHNAVEHEEGGFTSYFNFTGKCAEEEAKRTAFSLYFNNETNRIYSKPCWETGHSGYEDLKTPWLLYDLMSDDANLNGGNVPWSGFSTGEVYLSLYGKGITNTADIFVTTIDGINFDRTEYLDQNGPVVDVEKDDLMYDESTGNYYAPLGEKNKPYKVFDFNAYDEKTEVASKDIKVSDPNGKSVTLNNNSFVPTTTGDYLITYSAKDIYENETLKTLKVNIVDSVDELNASLTEELPTSIRYGEKLVLPSVNTSGGTGNIKTTISVVGDDGNEIKIDKMSIKALNKSSKYTISYTCSDYIGNEKTITREINVIRTDEIIFDTSLIVLPNEFVNYVDFTFSDYYGEFYDSSYVKHDVKAKILLTDSKGEHDLSSTKVYKPRLLKTEDVKLDFVFNYDDFELKITKNMVVRDPELNTTRFTSSYFSFDNASVEPNTFGIMLTPKTNEDLSFNFNKSIDCRDLILDLGINLEKVSMSSIDIYLRDSVNSEQIVKFTYTYEYVESLDAYKLLVSINNSKTKIITNLGIDSILRIDYSNTTHVVSDSTGSVITTLQSFLNGDKFEGFTSNSIYFDAVVHNPSVGNFEISVQKINNQVINSVRSDYQEPKIVVNGEIYSRVSRGSSIIVPAAYCYDVLSNVDELTVSLRKSDGTYIINPQSPDKDLSAVLNEVGTYVIEYKASDYNENETSITYVINVFDPSKPELIFSKDMPTQVEVNSTIELPDYTIVDNGDISKVVVSCCVYYPDGSLKVIKGNKVQITEKGTYVLTYVVIDENNNVSFYEFEFVAK